jgi:hypothetical protein
MKKLMCSTQGWGQRLTLSKGVNAYLVANAVKRLPRLQALLGKHNRTLPPFLRSGQQLYTSADWADAPDTVHVVTTCALGRTVTHVSFASSI